MEARYPAVYRDAWGEEQTTLVNDGETLSLALRGVLFTGFMLDDFAPSLSPNDPALKTFTLDRLSQGSAFLCAFTLNYDVPVPLVLPDDKTETAVLHVSFDLGAPKENGAATHEIIRLSLLWRGSVYNGGGGSGWFEDELKAISAALPENTYIKACINCAWGDYGVGGNGAFGCLLCFRGVKDEYRQARTKRDLLCLQSRATEAVQETYLCPHFARRTPGTGYRG